ncbi:MAG: helix-turn-helix domain-containing protein [Lachnospiraceae bacterium]|nr:helix-turn-helix domain-containing protein [Lachnospiraceae bacterium]
MLSDESLLYENKHFIIINDLNNNTFYYFDYDERDYAINMEFEHYHPFYEILILLSEEAEHFIEGHPYHIRQNDIVLLQPSRLHKSSYPKGDPSRRLVISFMFPDDKYGIPETYKQILAPFRADVPIFRFDGTERAKLFGILNEIYSFSDSPSYTGSETDTFYIHMKFQEFLHALYTLASKNTYKDDASFNSIERKIYDITAYIHAHYTEDLSLEMLADMFFISSCYLSHQFKAITHFNLMTYIQMTRIRNVEYRLITTDNRISDIAESCGFTSFSQFNRIFKKISGMSPSDFRKSGGSRKKNER